MATSHQIALSYLTFGQLWAIISTKDNWPLFEPYFPPRDNVDTKITEVKTIRNRIAHFREPNPIDTTRLALFMQDMEPGIRRFCNRCTQEKSLCDPMRDDVINALADDWDQVGYGIELMCPGRWLYAPGHHRLDPPMNARLDILAHKNSTSGSLAGLLYRVTVGSGNRPQQKSDTVQLFECTRALHGDIVHFLVSSFGDDVSITIPAILGVDRTADLIGNFLRAGYDARSGFPTSVDVSQLNWPEYVLQPDHMLNLFHDEMQGSILLLD